MTVMLKTKHVKPIICFSETFTVNLVQSLYLNLQALCTQVSTNSGNDVYNFSLHMYVTACTYCSKQ